MEEYFRLLEKSYPMVYLLGTCAGMILLSRRAYDRVIGETKQRLLGNLDIEVERNAFGRQNDSFEPDLEIPYR